MGYMRHHAIVVTGTVPHEDKDALAMKKLRDEIAVLAQDGTDVQHCVSEVTPIVVNGYCSFFIAPDGSKEGWSTSDAGDAFRDLVIALLEKRNGNGLWVHWAEVQFGDDENVNIVTRAY